MMLDLHHIDITVEPPDGDYETEHAWIYVQSNAYTDQMGIEAHTWGEVTAARIRTKGVLARLALTAMHHVDLEAREHGCQPTRRGEALAEPTRIDNNTCRLIGWRDIVDELANPVTLCIAVPEDRVKPWLKAISAWLSEISAVDQPPCNADEAIQ